MKKLLFSLLLFDIYFSISIGQQTQLQSSGFPTFTEMDLIQAPATNTYMPPSEKTWDMATEYSSSKNPNGVWSYGRKWSAESKTIDLFRVRWGSSGWYMGNAGHGGPSLQAGIGLWAKNNSNGLPVVRWTCPESGHYRMNASFIGGDSRGVNVVVYIALNDSVIFTDLVSSTSDSANYSFIELSLKEKDYIDFLIKWNGGTNSEYNWTRINAIFNKYATTCMAAIPDTFCVAGQIFRLPIKIYNADSLSRFNCRLHFNKNILQAQKIEKSDLTAYFSLADSLYSGQAAFSLNNAPEPFSGSGDLIYITFLVNPATMKGDTCSIAIDQIAVLDEKAQFIPVITRNGRFTVSDFKKEKISFGCFRQDTIKTPGAKKVYEFNGQANDKVTIRATELVGGNFDPKIELYDNNNKLLTQAWSGVQANVIDFALPAAGSYCIYISDENGVDKGSYWLSLECRQYSKSIAKPLSYGSYVQDTLKTPGAMRAYKFEGLADDKVTIRATELVGGNFDPKIELYDNNNKLLTQAWSGVQANVIDFALPAAGSYCIYISDENGVDKGSYWLSLECRQYSKSIAKPLSYGSYVQDTLKTPGAMSAYKFEGQANDKVTIRVTELVGGNFDPKIELYDDHNKLLTQAWSGVQANVIDFLLPAAGNYCIYVTDENGMDKGGYWFSLECRQYSKSIAKPLSYGSHVQDTLKTPGAMRVYKFEGQANDKVTIRVTELVGGNFDPKLELYDNNNRLLIQAWSGIQANVIDFLLPAAGSYCIYVTDENGMDKGGYWLKLIAPIPLVLEKSLQNQKLTGQGDENRYQIIINSLSSVIVLVQKTGEWNAIMRIKKGELPLLEPYLSTSGAGNLKLVFTAAKTDTYFIQLQSLSTGGQYSIVATTQDINTIYPAAPQNLVVKSSEQQNSLTWITDPTSDVLRYRIYRSTSSPANALYDSVAVNTNSYIDTRIEKGKTYFYRITAIDRKLNESLSSNETNSFIAHFADLIVSAVQTAPTAWSGQKMIVNWAVKNIGLDGTKTPDWHDRIYLSPHADFAAGDLIVLGTCSNFSYLNIGEAYKNMVEFTLPRGISGEYFIHVSTDVDEVLAEVNEQNNHVSSSAIQIKLTPPPDLRISSVTTPANAFSGETLRINWTVKNAGPGITEEVEWFDTVFLSKDETFDFIFTLRPGIIRVDELSLGTHRHAGALQSDSSYAASLDIALPQAIYGTYYLFVYTDIANEQFVAEDGQVYEYNQNMNNNRGRMIQITLAPPPDLVVTDIIAPDTASFGQLLNVQWTVQNQGPGAPFESGWNDQLYISPSDSFIAGSAISLGVFYHNAPLAPGASYTQLGTVKIPGGLAGRKFLYVKTDDDNRIFEHTFDNNNFLRKIGPITVNTPDFVVTSIKAPDDAGSGKPVEIAWTVQNQGKGTISDITWSDRIYLVREPTFDRALAIPLGIFARSGKVPPDSAYIERQSGSLPNGISGKYFIFIETDCNNVIYENLAENNNITLCAKPISVQLSPWPDLQVVDIQSATLLTAGERMTVTWTVQNIGNGDASTPAWTDRIMICSGTTFDPAKAILLASAGYAKPLGAGQSYTQSRTATLPTSYSGTYSIVVQTDIENSVYEHTDEANNTSQASQLYIRPYPPIDLTIAEFKPPKTGNSGQALALNWIVKNNGSGTTIISDWLDKVYLSPDLNLNPAADYLLLSCRHSGVLRPGESYTQATAVTLPDGLFGSFYVFLCSDADGQSTDANRSNNTMVSSIPLIVSLTPSPDLAVAQLVAPGQVRSGQPMLVKWSVLNKGPGVTTKSVWYEAIFLSADAKLDKGDMCIGTYKRNGALAADASYSDSLEVDIPVFASGAYFLIFNNDSRNDLYEHNGEDNNTAATGLAAIQSLPADLVVKDITVPANAIPGENATIQWTLQNQGEHRATGRLRDAVYISSDTTWQIDDPLLGVLDHSIDLLSGGSKIFKMSANLTKLYKVDDLGNITEPLPGVAPGAYHAIVRTDIRNNIRESDDSNNTLVSIDTMETDIPELKLGIPKKARLAKGEMRYYQIEAPANGKTMRIRFDSAEETAVNELYLRFADVPSRTEFDYKSDEPLKANQQITVPNQREGTYYLMVRNSAMKKDSLEFSLSANILEFGIESIDLHEGGQGGEVTIRIRGAEFTPNLAANLFNTETRLASKSIYWIDPTEVYATFDLKDMRIANYNMEIKQMEARIDFNTNAEPHYKFKIDSTISTLPNIFNVVPFNPSPMTMEINAPSQVRAGQKFEVLLQVSNQSNNDMPSPLLLLYGMPSIDAAINGTVSEYNNIYQILAISKQGPAGLLRPGESTTVPINIIAPVQMDTLHVTIIQASESKIPLDFAQEMINLGISENSVNWQSSVTFLNRALQNDWGKYQQLLSATATRLQREGVSDFNYEDLLIALLNEVDRDTTFIIKDKNLTHNPFNRGEDFIIHADDITQFSKVKTEWDCNPLLLLSLRDRLREFGSLLTQPPCFAVTAARHLSLFLDKNSAPQVYSNYSLVAGELRLHVGAKRSYAMVRYDAEEKHIKKQIEIDFKTGHPKSNIYFTDIQVGRPPDFYVALGPIQNAIPLIPPGSDLAFAFGGMRTPWEGNVYHINKEGEKCSKKGEKKVTYSATVEYLFNDLYDFHLGLSALDDAAANLNFCGWASTYLTYIHMSEKIKGDIIVDDEGCCENDTDCDGIPDDKDDDIDGDGKKNGDDDDVDGDGMPNGKDPDVDGDGIPNGKDPDIDGDRIPNGKDPDVDGDGILNGEDRDVDGDGIPNSEDDDIDGDGIANGSDSDMDGDGIPNDQDNDMDGDGIPNNQDPEPRGPGSRPGANIPIGQPRDPNDIWGPEGYGERRWITSTQTLSYTIHFENDPNQATAPAQIVRITQQLDSTLDARSFRLGSFGFGNSIFQVPENSAAYTKRLDFSDSLGLYVDVNAGIDVNTNNIFWTFTSIDPATGEVPAFAGFLKINDAFHHGEGFVNYSIRPKLNSCSGDIVHARASIIFDINAPIETPGIFNTIDAGVPHSLVTALTPVLNVKTFTLKWAGTDDADGSRIQSFKVFVSENGGPFELYEDTASDTSLVFSGDWGSTYRFYTIATDFAGNVEPIKNKADASITLDPRATTVASSEGVLPEKYALFQNYPNPFNPSTTFRFDLPSATHVKLSIYNILGQKIKTLLNRNMIAGFHSIQWNGTNDASEEVASGMYLYRLEAIVQNASSTNRFIQTKKLLLLK